MKIRVGVLVCGLLLTLATTAARAMESSECKLIKVEVKVGTETILGAHDIASAHEVKTSPGRARVEFELTEDAKQQFASVTQKNLGRHLEVYVDGKEIKKSLIRDRVADGRGELGSFALPTAENIVNRLSCTDGWVAPK